MYRGRLTAAFLRKARIDGKPTMAETGRHIGGVHFKRTNVRVIGGSKNDLNAMVDQGSFNERLFHRLDVFPIFLPPLRERRDDIPKLAHHFLNHFCMETGKRIEGFSEDAM